MRRSSLSAVLLVLACTASAAEPVPEIRRDAAPAQAVGVAHTLRTIPEACARLEGMFTGDAAKPYRFTMVRTSPQCQPRARFVDAAKAKPSEAAGWRLNDVIRVPSAACPAQQAVVRVWRKPGDAAPPALDAQGRARLYLKDGGLKAPAARGSTPTAFAAVVDADAAACR